MTSSRADGAKAPATPGAPADQPGPTPLTLTPGKPIRLARGALIAEVQPGCGARLSRLARRDTRGDLFDYLVPLGNEPFSSDEWPKAGAFPMLPYTNMLRDDTLHWRGSTIAVHEAPATSSSLHGWGLRRAWEVVDESPHCCVLQLDSPAQPEWPWHYQAYLSVTLDDQGVDMQLSLTNLSAQEMPAGLGLHPYFRWPAGARVTFESEALWRSPSEDIRWPSEQRVHVGPMEVVSVGGGLDTGGRSTWFAEVPTESGRFDARIDYAGGLRSATVRSDDATWLVLHSPAGRPYLCLEPSTHRVGEFDTDHAVLAHGQTLDLSMRIDLA
ncbi:aldose epimerase family protein [Pandoraea sputorum]|uniref:Aldose 1-epimerase n=1 Tax=Pandoraea sputorum TaxID=93222 RepID=A0A239SU30_9BURK|nr:hypothetical protein [Pandoraea sputorum]AJC15009.1 hypothetical protein NA29_01190 [Pandoraea sputorum]SNU89001.1 Aldose 1-epimerase [Pandoraea sputorum]VVE41624.1 hypothetical protein PSP20601_04169 [Pandoraea sputorum]